MRLFVGIRLLDKLRKQLVHWQPNAVDKVRLVPPDLMHITLYFVGDGDPHKLNNTLRQVSSSRFSIQINGVGQFKKNGYILWAGVEKNRSLTQLQQKISECLNQDGYGQTEQNYRPHVTLARCKKGVDARVVETFMAQVPVLPSMPVESFQLYVSRQVQGRLCYDVLYSYPLQ